jgi:hypothetical protein
VNIVDPLNLSEEFKSILQNRMVASQVKAKLIVNQKYLYIRDEDLEVAEAKAYESENPSAKKELDALKKSIVEKDIGNANVETEITFEYGVRRLSAEEKKSAKKLDKLPFQLQISYTTPDGAKALRVYTKIQEFTSERAKAEKEIRRDLLYANYAQKMSNQVSNSSVSTAQYRGQQLQSLNERYQWDAPEMLNENISMIRNMSLSQRANDLSDMNSKYVYQAKKANRNMFSFL